MRGPLDLWLQDANSVARCGVNGRLRHPMFEAALSQRRWSRRRTYTVFRLSCNIIDVDQITRGPTLAISSFPRLDCDHRTQGRDWAERQTFQKDCSTHYEPVYEELWSLNIPRDNNWRGQLNDCKQLALILRGLSYARRSRDQFTFLNNVQKPFFSMLALMIEDKLRNFVSTGLKTLASVIHNSQIKNAEYTVLWKLIEMQDDKMRYYLYVLHSHPTVVPLELSTLCRPLWRLANFSIVLQLP